MIPRKTKLLIGIPKMKKLKYISREDVLVSKVVKLLADKKLLQNKIFDLEQKNGHEGILRKV